MSDLLTSSERYPRGGSDFWDTPAAALVLDEFFPASDPELTPRRALIWLSDLIQEVPTAMLGTGKLPIVLMPDGTLKQRQTSEGVPLVLVSGVLRQINSLETLEI
jgi:hypothetical protein